MSARWDDTNTRRIVCRLVITGALTLLTPARFGGGEGSPGSGKVTDMPLARDPQDQAPLLTGSSIAGALRSYLREWELGYEKAGPERVGTRFQKLFGHVVDGKTIPEDEKQSLESWLIVDDARAVNRCTETRPGVAINPTSRTVKTDEKGRGFLYDMELLEAGTQFPLRFELALPDDEDKQQLLLEGLAVALTGFECGEIGLGTRKRRGLGECIVANWQVEEYDLKNGAGLLAWLEAQPGRALPSPVDADGKPDHTLAAKLGVKLPDDKRCRFILEAKFHLETSLLIRSGSEDPAAPDMVHLKSHRNGTPRPILSGTSLAGALRARALRIANTIAPIRSETLVTDIFGPAEVKPQNQRKKGEEPYASRAVVHEREITNEYERVQSRVKIDRFTGGSFPGALFDQQPVMGKKGQQPNVIVSVELRKPEKEHIGLLLHLLKDLWTGDLPLGGEASVGRGRLQGMEATLKFHSPNPTEQGTWRILADETQIGMLKKVEGSFDKLETFAQSVGGGK